ncbi:homeodomain class 2 protein [Tubulinosema ratisbonensis]|uniref:Homeodomain class 2 protein n=1 Tax=Tubulinosema ratisbonensis TaxID=291195 RepID=A0A437AJ37_9MICR|nr:homeodomain class 2 protein [Tubulinosema ratisbonensis]
MKIIDVTQEIKKSYSKNKPPKRNRIKLNYAQKKALEMYFQHNKYPTYEIKMILEKEFLIPEKNIVIWFQNRRAKEKEEK